MTVPQIDDFVYAYINKTILIKQPNDLYDFREEIAGKFLGHWIVAAYMHLHRNANYFDMMEQPMEYLVNSTHLYFMDLAESWITSSAAVVTTATFLV